MAETPLNYFCPHFSSQRGGLQAGEGRAGNRRLGQACRKDGRGWQTGWTRRVGGGHTGWSQTLTSSPRKPPAQRSLSKTLAGVQETTATAAAAIRTVGLPRADARLGTRLPTQARALGRPSVHRPRAAALTASEASGWGQGTRPPVSLSLKDQTVCLTHALCFRQISLSSLSC